MQCIGTLEVVCESAANECSLSHSNCVCSRLGPRDGGLWQSRNYADLRGGVDISPWPTLQQATEFHSWCIWIQFRLETWGPPEPFARINQAVSVSERNPVHWVDCRRSEGTWEIWGRNRQAQECYMYSGVALFPRMPGLGQCPTGTCFLFQEITQRFHLLSDFISKSWQLVGQAKEGPEVSPVARPWEMRCCEIRVDSVAILWEDVPTKLDLCLAKHKFWRVRGDPALSAGLQDVDMENMFFPCCIVGNKVVWDLSDYGNSW